MPLALRQAYLSLDLGLLVHEGLLVQLLIKEGIDQATLLGLQILDTLIDTRLHGRDLILFLRPPVDDDLPQ
ncbi:MAG: hypothetical protein QGH15_18370 [Kiritimatiellia bacterium]|nr:hypothetical protein [Kiritimatiellia bacterium]